MTLAELPSIEIRRARLGDVDAIVRLVQAGAPEGVRREPIEGPIAAAYLDAFVAIDRDPKCELMVADLGGTIVGTFHLTYLTYLIGKGREDAQLESVHVSAAMRGKGVGALMMRWAIERATQRGCRRLQLTTDKLRTDAHRFYRRLGFVASHEGMKLVLPTA